MVPNNGIKASSPLDETHPQNMTATCFLSSQHKILTNYLMIENTLLFHIRNQYPKGNQKSEYRKICSISILTN